MKKVRFLALLIVLSLFFVGCGAMVHNVSDNMKVISYPAELRGAYIFRKTDDKNNTTYRYCSEPGPDVALKTVSELSANLKGIVTGTEKVDAVLAARLSTDVVALAGRTQLVLVARDMLYAICELSVNHDLTKDEVNGMYKDVANVLVTLANADKKAAEATASEAKAKLLKISKEVKALITEQDRKIGRVIFHVTDKEGRLLRDKLESLVKETEKDKDTKLAEDTKAEILGAVSADHLRVILSEEVDWAIEPLFKKLPQQ